MSAYQYFYRIGQSDRSQRIGCRNFSGLWPLWAQRAYKTGFLNQGVGCV